MRYNAKVSAIEETKDLAMITMEELLSTLTTYGMRINTEDRPSTIEATFKATKKTRNKELKVKGTPDDESDEEANFIRKLKRGTKKHKGKLPLKCFDCDRINHYAKRCLLRKRKASTRKIFILNKTITLQMRVIQKKCMQEKFSS